jgi:hypothetical protein
MAIGASVATGAQRIDICRGNGITPVAELAQATNPPTPGAPKLLRATTVSAPINARASQRMQHDGGVAQKANRNIKHTKKFAKKKAKAKRK